MRTILFLVLVAASALLLTGCFEPDGDKCDTCSSNDDCTGGRECYVFGDGINRCADEVGDTCRSFSKNSLMAP